MCRAAVQRGYVVRAEIIHLRQVVQGCGPTALSCANALQGSMSGLKLRPLCCKVGWNDLEQMIKCKINLHLFCYCEMGFFSQKLCITFNSSEKSKSQIKVKVIFHFCILSRQN